MSDDGRRRAKRSLRLLWVWGIPGLIVLLLVVNLAMSLPALIRGETPDSPFASFFSGDFVVRFGLPSQISQTSCPSVVPNVRTLKVTGSPATAAGLGATRTTWTSSGSNPGRTDSSARKLRTKRKSTPEMTTTPRKNLPMKKKSTPGTRIAVAIRPRMWR